MARSRVTVTVADFRTQFPEFAATTDAAIELALEEGLLLHSIRKLATLYASAHVLSYRLTAIAGGGGGGSTTVTGQVSRRRVGPLGRRIQHAYGQHAGQRHKPPVF